MLIEVLTSSHAAQYKALMLHAYEHAADAFTSTVQERAKEPDAWWIHRLDNPAGLSMVFGAFENQRLVGTVALEFSAKPKSKHKATVLAMYVLEPYRGIGIARALLVSAIKRCESRGDIRIIQLEVTDGNKPATELYQRQGFGTFGVEPMAVFSSGKYLSKVHMWLNLADTHNPASV